MHELRRINIDLINISTLSFRVYYVVHTFLHSYGVSLLSVVISNCGTIFLLLFLPRYLIRKHGMNGSRRTEMVKENTYYICEMFSAFDTLYQLQFEMISTVTMGTAGK